MINITGFLPFSRANFLMDFVVVAMAIIVPILIGSVFLVRYRKLYVRHRQIQITLAALLAITLVLFELDVRLNGWQHLAEPSPYYQTLVFPALAVHLCFAIPTFFLWLFTIIGAWSLPKSWHGRKRAIHRILGRSSVLFLIGTAFTGWIFFWLAFVS